MLRYLGIKFIYKQDLRSLAFDLLETGLETNKTKAFETMKLEILNEVLLNFDTDKFDETRIPRLRILLKLSYDDSIQKVKIKIFNE